MELGGNAMCRLEPAQTQPIELNLEQIGPELGTDWSKLKQIGPELGTPWN